MGCAPEEGTVSYSLRRTLKPSRKSQRARASPHKAEVECALNLSVMDVRILWAPVYIAVDQDLLQWGPDSATNNSVFVRMKSASYRLIALIKSCSPPRSYQEPRNRQRDYSPYSIHKMTPWPRP